MPSQYNEHEFILQYFAGRIGRFLDVGAYDGATFSNTRCLMDLGWSGVCVEPSPLVFPHLKSNTEQFPAVECIEAAIVPDTTRCDGHINLWATQDALSTLDHTQKVFMERHYRNVDYKEVRVKAFKWEQFLQTHPLPYDFINIDVEGLNWEVLRDGPMAEMVCVEIDPGRLPTLQEHLKIFGLPNHKQIGGNLLAWRDK